MVGGRRPQHRPRPAYYHNMAGQLRPAALHQQYFQHVGYLGHVESGHDGYLGHVDNTVDTVYHVTSHAAETPASYPDTHVGSSTLLP